MQCVQKSLEPSWNQLRCHAYSITCNHLRIEIILCQVMFWIGQTQEIQQPTFGWVNCKLRLVQMRYLSEDKVGILLTFSFRVQFSVLLAACEQVHCVLCPVLVGIRTSQAVFAVLECIWMLKPLIRWVMWPCKRCHLSAKCRNML